MCRILELTLVLLFFAFANFTMGQTEWANGRWNCELDSPGGGLKFGLIVEGSGGQNVSAFLCNGDERIKIPVVAIEQGKIRLRIDYFKSEIVATVEPNKNELTGIWRKRKDAKTATEMRFSARRAIEDAAANPDANEPFIGRFAVKFSSSGDPAVGVFKSNEAGDISGTFLTSTGDYRFLDGQVNEGVMELSCFDGAHAFLFRAKSTGQGALSGDFWSGSAWHETWTGTRDKNAQLLDGFAQTSEKNGVDLGRLSFPDLAGKPRRLDEPEFQGSVRIIYVFGTWCPNCHDAADFFGELQRDYGARGLKILGLAFEASGDFEEDSAQLRLYLQKHSVDYPVLLAGISDKAAAGKVLPFLDQVRAFPTTIFLDAGDQIIGIYTGFSGPATGVEYSQLKRQFRETIEPLLTNNR